LLDPPPWSRSIGIRFDFFSPMYFPLPRLALLLKEPLSFVSRTSAKIRVVFEIDRNPYPSPFHGSCLAGRFAGVFF